MIKSTNLGGKTLVVDKIEEIFPNGGEPKSVTKIKDVVSTQVQKKKLDELKKDLEAISSDGVITSYEKQGLKREWASLEKAFYSTVEAVKKDDTISHSTEYTELANKVQPEGKFWVLKNILDKVFADTSTDYVGDDVKEITTLFVQCWELISILDTRLQEKANGEYEFSVSIVGNRSVVKSTTLTAKVERYINGVRVEITELLASELTWTIYGKETKTLNGTAITVSTIDMGKNNVTVSLAFKRELGGFNVFQKTDTTLSYGEYKQYAWSNALKQADLEPSLQWYEVAPSTPTGKYLWKRVTTDNGDTWAYFRETGEQGEQGPQGNPGPQGEPGKVFRAEPTKKNFIASKRFTTSYIQEIHVDLYAENTSITVDNYTVLTAPVVQITKNTKSFTMQINGSIDTDVAVVVNFDDKQGYAISVAFVISAIEQGDEPMYLGKVQGIPVEGNFLEPYKQFIPGDYYLRTDEVMYNEVKIGAFSPWVYFDNTVRFAPFKTPPFTEQYVSENYAKIMKECLIDAVNGDPNKQASATIIQAWIQNLAASKAFIDELTSNNAFLKRLLVYALKVGAGDENNGFLMQIIDGDPPKIEAKYNGDRLWEINASTGKMYGNFAEVLQYMTFNFDDSLDYGHPFECEFYIPESAKIKSISLNARGQKFRAYSKSAFKSQQLLGTIESETTNSFWFTNPKVVVNTIPYPSSTDEVSIAVPTGSTEGFADGEHYHDSSYSSGQHSHKIGVNREFHSHGLPNNLAIGGEYEVQQAEHKHNINLNLDISHSHDLEFGIYEGETPKNVKLTIDNGRGYNTSPIELGSESILAKDINISNYLSGFGWKKVKFESETRGRITVQIIAELLVTT